MYLDRGISPFLSRSVFAPEAPHVSCAKEERKGKHLTPVVPRVKRLTCHIYVGRQSNGQGGGSRDVACREYRVRHFYSMTNIASGDTV